MDVRRAEAAEPCKIAGVHRTQPLAGLSKRDGSGTLTHTNGDVFEGTFRAGVRHGRGVQRTAAGTTYEGEWVDDALEGPVVVAEGSLFASQPDGRVVVKSCARARRARYAPDTARGARAHVLHPRTVR